MFKTRDIIPNLIKMERSLNYLHQFKSWITDHRHVSINLNLWFKILISGRYFSDLAQILNLLTFLSDPYAKKIVLKLKNLQGLFICESQFSKVAKFVKRNWVFVTRSNFLIFFFATVDLWYYDFCLFEISKVCTIRLQRA